MPENLKTTNKNLIKRQTFKNTHEDYKLIYKFIRVNSWTLSSVSLLKARISLLMGNSLSPFDKFYIRFLCCLLLSNKLKLI